MKQLGTLSVLIVSYEVPRVVNTNKPELVVANRVLKQDKT